MASTSSSSAASMVNVVPQPQPQVFINFRGTDLRNNFITHLVRTFKEKNINYYIDEDEKRSEPIEILFKRIKDSKIALAIFSEHYAEANWCLDELVEIMEHVKTGSLRVIPVFVKVKPEDVKEQKGDFGVKLYGQGRRKRPRMPQWEDALEAVPTRMGLVLPENGSTDDLLLKIVKAIKDLEPEIIAEMKRNNVLSANISTMSCNGESCCASATIEQPIVSLPPYGIEQRLKKLEEKFNFETEETQIIGIIGMPGIGKTTIADEHYKRKITRFCNHQDIREIRDKSAYQSHWLKDTLLNGQELNEEGHMWGGKFYFLLDDVSEKNQVDFLIENLERIKKGSKIVITTRDKSSIADLVRDIDTYVVPGLNDIEALKLFKHHAFTDHASSQIGKFMELSKMFVDYAGGNPLALEELGKELRGLNEDQWKERLTTLPHCCNPNIRTELKISYDKLTDQQKDAFLDVACFFRLEEVDYVNCLLDPYSPESGKAVRDLAGKLIISISTGRIEMHNILCTLGKELGSSDSNKSGERMWYHETIIDTLRLVNPNQQKKKVRGIFVDTSKVEKEMPIRQNIFIDKFDKQTLRYLKIYDSVYPQQCESCHTDGKLNLPDRLKFPFQEIRLFHWLKFPLDELPSDFNPDNLIDLRLPYSKIERVWNAVKETPWLKWVDLSYSTKLTDLSALSKAFHVRRLNLEGCSDLAELPKDMKIMKSLVLLNLRGCTKLSSLPLKLNLFSLTTLILSGCSKFTKFELISENLEFLHLDGTAIENLPSTIQTFQKLVLLNLKDCAMLDSLPDCLDKLKALEELIVSGCAKLRKFPDIKENMKNLQILLIDGTSIKEFPKILFHLKEQTVFQRSPRMMNGLSMLGRLCLSGNDMICRLHSDISELYHLKWIDLKYCSKLESISMLPPNLQCLDAHACNSLKTVATPLALPMTTQQVSSSFIFTNCEQLDHIARNEIISYAHNRSRMISDALNRYDKGLTIEALVATCFPGSEVPAWFSYKASGAMLNSELRRHWRKSGFVGIALCAIVSFKYHKIQNNLQVKCICRFNNVETSSSYFNCNVGGLAEADREQRTINSTHVFLGYTNWLNINKCQEEDCEKECDSTKASIKFEVTDGTSMVTNCEVLKCGFSFVYETGSWEISSRIETKPRENRSLSLLKIIRNFLRI